MATTPKRQLSQNTNHDQGNTWSVLSTNSKPRLKWTTELHERFIEAVNQLGGAYKATPKTIMKQMGIQGITLNHLKSHLQKYRMSTYFPGQSSTENMRNVTGDRRFDDNEDSTYEVIHASHTTNLYYNIRSLQISQALPIQIEVQRRSHEHLEVQKNLQVQMEDQGKYQHAFLECLHGAIGRENLGPNEVEATRNQPVQLASKIPVRYPDTSTAKLTDLLDLCSEKGLMDHLPNFSKNSCLNLFKECQNDNKMHHNMVCLEAYHRDLPLAPNVIGKKQIPKLIDLTQFNKKKDELVTPTEKGQKITPSPEERTSDNLTISIGIEGYKESNSSSRRECWELN